MSKELKEVETSEDELSDVVELTDDSGRVLKFFHLGTLEHKERWFLFFQPAEKIEGADMDEVVIFELSGDENNEVLIPVEDEKLLEEVYEEFCRQMEEEDDADEAAEVEGCSCGCGCDDDCDCGCKEGGDCDCKEDDCDCKEDDCDCKEDGKTCGCDEDCDCGCKD